MSDSDGSDGSASSGYRRRYRTPSPREPNVTLAKIFMIDGNGLIHDWDGKEPNGNRLVVHVTIGNTTYRGYFRNKKKCDSDFDSMRSGRFDPQKLQGTSFLHCPDGSIILPLMEGAPNFNEPGESYCRIYKYKDNDKYTFWYKLYDYDDKVTSDDKTIHVKDSELGKPGSTTEQYTPYCHYFPGGDLYIFRREVRREPGVHRQRTPPRRGGGKTRRKFKVKKRRNRRIRNTMKRRKTAVKRRNGRK
jgi:hypothetical protein